MEMAQCLVLYLHTLLFYITKENRAEYGESSHVTIVTIM